jgi:hypothetical protein
MDFLMDLSTRAVEWVLQMLTSLPTLIELSVKLY